MVAGLQVIPNAILFEVPIVAAGLGKRNFFPDVPQIRGKKVTGFAIFGANQSALAPSGSANIVNSSLASVNVSLIDQKNNVFVDTIPANFFNLLAFGQPLRNVTPSRSIKVQSCFFEYTASGIVGTVILCAFFYE